jgi:hypothetical protein
VAFGIAVGSLLGIWVPAAAQAAPFVCQVLQYLMEVGSKNMMLNKLLAIGILIPLLILVVPNVCASSSEIKKWK